MECAKLSLQNLEIKSEKYFESVKLYLNTLNVALNTQHVIPLFYDYSCENGWTQCWIKYRSLNSNQSGLQNSLIHKYFNKAFLFVMQLTDYVGFGLSKQGELMRFRLNDKYFIKGVLCSSNYEIED